MTHFGQPLKPTQPPIPPGSVNECQLQLGRQRQVWLIPTADERAGVQVVVVVSIFSHSNLTCCNERKRGRLCLVTEFNTRGDLDNAAGIAVTLGPLDRVKGQNRRA